MINQYTRMHLDVGRVLVAMTLNSKGLSSVQVWSNYSPTRGKNGTGTHLIHEFNEHYKGPAHALLHVLNHQEVKDYLYDNE